MVSLLSSLHNRARPCLKKVISHTHSRVTVSFLSSLVPHFFFHFFVLCSDIVFLDFNISGIQTLIYFFLFIHSFFNWFTHSFIHLLTCFFMRDFIHSLLFCSCMDLSIYSSNMYCSLINYGLLVSGLKRSSLVHL